MKPNIVLLEARVKNELLQLEKLCEELKSLATITEHNLKNVKLRAYASILHDFYSGIEKIFIAVAREIDQDVPKSNGWHRLLLEQMTLDMPSRRPPVIDKEFAFEIQQYLSFRHRFRNMYGYELEWGKMEELIEEMPTIYTELRDRLEDFIMICQML